MKRFFHFTFILALFVLPVQADDLRHPSSLNSFCVDPDRDALCSAFPDDQTDFSDKFVYMFINVETQSPFDIFSWQAFVSLNWPETGLPQDVSVANWGDFNRREQVFANDPAFENCGLHSGNAEVITANLLQADGNILVDQNGNFIVYETRINPAAEDYILEQILNTEEGQIANASNPISFPQGRIGNDPTPASVLVKTSWQVMTPETDQSQYIVKNGLIFVPAEFSANGKDMCIRETLGMIGMHIVTRTDSGNGDEWLWSTFEHRDTAPDAGNSRRVNAIFSNDLFPGGCSAATKNSDVSYILYNKDCPDCATNKPATGEFIWSKKPPYAQAAPSQIVRCWEVFEGTFELKGSAPAEC